MKKDLDSYYGSRIDKYGLDSAKSCGYINEESHRVRQDYMNSLIYEEFKGNKVNTLRILDIGVGPRYMLYKELIDLRFDNICWDYNYIGLEISDRVIKEVSKDSNIPINSVNKDGNGLFTSMDLLYSRFDLIVCNGVLQDSSDLQSIRDTIVDSAQYLSKNGVLIIILPSNIVPGDSNEVYISPYDLVSIASQIGLPYRIEYGELGKHMSLVIRNKGVR